MSVNLALAGMLNNLTGELPADLTSLLPASSETLDGAKKARLTQAMENLELMEAQAGTENSILTMLKMGLCLVNEDQVEELMRGLAAIPAEYNRLEHLET